MHSSPSATAPPGTEEFPVEDVSDEEMAAIDAALAAVAAGARPLLSAASRRAAAPLSCAAYSVAGPAGGDIEDSPWRSRLARFRQRRALAVTDITATEWCEKQMEFVLEHGRPERTQAMKAGSVRHAQLEQEVSQHFWFARAEMLLHHMGSILRCVPLPDDDAPGKFLRTDLISTCFILVQVVERVDVTIRSEEERWAVKFMNFIVGTNQLLYEGRTREIPVIGVVEGSWMIGIVDEIRMPMDGQPMLVDTKTRSSPTSPSEPQKRNGRLQLMCYKHLWDNLITGEFPAENFFSYFDLDPRYKLSDDLTGYMSSLEFNAETFEDVLKYFKITCHTLSMLRSQEQLLLRYELQADHSLLEEYHFPYDARWFKDQIQEVLSFWQGPREPKFVTEEERWKCSFCKFAPNCPMIASMSRC